MAASTSKSTDGQQACVEEDTKQEEQSAYQVVSNE
jgi:hypothetical protein